EEAGKTATGPPEVNDPRERQVPAEHDPQPSPGDGGPDDSESDADSRQRPEPDEEGPFGRSEDRFFVAGIGASAGGLDAIGERIRHVLTDQIAFIVVQHLAPDHESILTELLARNSRLRVSTAVDGVALQPGRVYV